MASKPTWLDDEESQPKFGVSGSQTSNPSYTPAWSSDTNVPASNPSKSKSTSSFLPSWTQSKEVTPAVAKSVTTSVAASADKAAPVDATPEEITQINRWRMIVSFFSVAAAVNLAVSAGLSLVGQLNISAAFFAVYTIFFAGMILIYEFAFGVSSIN